jgi:cation-transporting P-type ATPase C
LEQDPLGIRIFVGQQGKLIGIIEVVDTVKPDAPRVIKDLGRMGVKRVGILTGDVAASAERAADRCHIDVNNIRAGLTPKQKAEAVKEYKQKNRPVFLAGDGINDIPAMKEADVAVSFGRGLAPSHEYADIVVINDDLKALPECINISKAVIDVVSENLILSAGLNYLGLWLAVLNIINPFAISIYHDINSLLIIINSIKALKTKL